MSLMDTQESIEYMYDKSRIGNMIQRDIQDTTGMLPKITECLNALMTVYLQGPHFTMKGEYLANVSEDSLSKAIYRILEVMMPLPKGCALTSLVGQVASVIKTERVIDSFKVISSVVSYMYYFGLLKVIRADDSKLGMLEILPIYVCDDKISSYIKQTKYLPPMVCAPRKLVDNTTSGYLTRAKDSLILKSYNHHEGNICLDTLNKFNAIAYSLDTRMLTTYDEMPKQLLDTHQKEQQFSKLREDSYGVFKLLIQSGNNFHLTHKVDKRGRTYCCGFHVSTQGNSFRKAIINLAKQELVHGTFT